MYICCAFTWPKIHICIKYIYAKAKANIHLVWAGVYLHGGLYLHMCKLTFTYMQLRSHAQNTYMYTCNLHTVCKSAHVNGVKHGYILSSRSDNKIIKYGSAKVTKVPKLCREILPTEMYLRCCFSTIRVKWPKFSFKNTNVSLLNAMYRIYHKNALKLTINYFLRIKMLNENVPVHKVDACSG